MNHATFVKEFPHGQQAVALRTGVEADPASIAEALGLPVSSAVLLLSGGAGLMSKKMLNRLRALFAAVAEVLAQEQVVVIDGGTQSGVMALMGEALAKAGRTAPYIGILPAHAEIKPGGPRGEETLEPHHSHFVLVESDQWGSESKTMCDLATYLAAEAPSLVLLVNGGEIALQDVEWNVRQGREIVVIAGSGRLADEIAKAVRCPNRRTRDRIAAVAREGRVTLFDLSASPAELVALLKHKLKGESEMTLENENTEKTERHAALEDAWQSFAIYDHNSGIAQKRFLRLRKWILGLGVAATFLAIFHSVLKPVETPWIAQANDWLRYLVILAPILVTILQAGAAKFKGGANYVLLRGSAEALKRQIYRYRAQVGIYGPGQTEPREVKLARRVKTICGQLMKTEVNQGGLRLYKGDLPPQYGAHKDDDGFSNLDSDEYVAWRLEDQLKFYRSRIERFDRQLRQIHWLILGLGGIGTFLAAIGFEVWIAVTVALAGAFVSFLALKQVEDTLVAYNQAAANLEGIRIWWHALPDEDKAKQENKEKLVQNTEMVLQTELAGWVQEMRDALAELYEETEEPGETSGS